MKRCLRSKLLIEHPKCGGHMVGGIHFHYVIIKQINYKK